MSKEKKSSSNLEINKEDKDMNKSNNMSKEKKSSSNLEINKEDKDMSKSNNILGLTIAQAIDKINYVANESKCFEVINMNINNERDKFINRHVGVKFVPVHQSITNVKRTKAVLENVIAVVPVLVEGELGLAGCYKSGQVQVLTPNGKTLKYDINGDLKSNKISLIGSRCRYQPVVYHNSFLYERIMLIFYGIMMDLLPEDIDNLEVNNMDYSGSLKTRAGKDITFNFNVDNLEWCTPAQNSLHKTKMEEQFKKTGELTGRSVYDMD